MKKFMLPILLLMALQGDGQILEIEYGGGIHYAQFSRESLSPNYSFQTKENYYTFPSLTFLLRMNFGWESFPVHFFILNHLNIDYDVDKDRIFKNTILQNSSPSLGGKFSQYSLFIGPGLALPPFGNVLLHLNIGVGFSSIRMPSVYFDCNECFEPKLFNYADHGGLGLGGLLEASMAYRFSDKIRLAMTYSFHGGRMYNTSVEYWGASWGSRQAVPTPNIVRWKNSLLSWSFIYSIQKRTK